MKRRRILFLADSSSQLKPAYRIADQFRKLAGWEVVGNIVPGPGTPSRRQVMEANLHCPLTGYSVAKLSDLGTLLNFDAVLSFMPGSRLHSFVFHLERSIASLDPVRRPVTLTGYNGAVYEGHLEGLLWRTGYDLIAVNSRRDQRLFSSQLAELEYPADNLVSIGFALASSEKPKVARFADMPRQDILFATQAIVPESRRQREYILEKLRAYAEAFPGRKVYIKPRTFPNERTFHTEEHHYALLYDQLYGKSRPENLLFAYGSLDAYLPRVGLVVSVSSTAVLEALSYGVPGAILSDFGIKESLGNHFFKSSGLLTTFPRLYADDVPQPDPAWMADNGLGPDDSPSVLIDRVEALLTEQEERGRLPMREPYYTAERAPYVYERTIPVKQQAHGDGPRRRSRVQGLARKGRKLVRSPREFIADAKVVKAAKKLLDD